MTVPFNVFEVPPSVILAFHVPETVSFNCADATISSLPLKKKSVYLLRASALASLPAGVLAAVVVAVVVVAVVVVVVVGVAVVVGVVVVVGVTTADVPVVVSARAASIN